LDARAKDRAKSQQLTSDSVESYGDLKLGYLGLQSVLPTVARRHKNVLRTFERGMTLYRLTNDGALKVHANEVWARSTKLAQDLRLVFATHNVEKCHLFLGAQLHKHLAQLRGCGGVYQPARSRLNRIAPSGSDDLRRMTLPSGPATARGLHNTHCCVCAKKARNYPTRTHV
jgi:hypothetical protein